MIICPQCSQKNQDFSVFCEKCHRYFRREERVPGAAVLFQTAPRPVTKNPTIRIDRHQQTSSDELFPTQSVTVDKAKSADVLPSPRRSSTVEATIDDDYEVDSPEKPGPPKNDVVADQPVWLISNRNMLLGGLLAALVLAIAAYFMISSAGSPVDTGNTALFAEAEILYSNQDYQAALQIYTRFADLSPQTQLSDLARLKIEQINLLLQSETTPEERAMSLLLVQAENAIKDQRFTQPEEQNAFYYIEQIKALDPANPGIDRLFDGIASAYNDYAAEAIKAQNYARAGKYYERILQIRPGDQVTSEKLDLLKKLVGYIDASAQRDQAIAGTRPGSERGSSGPLQQIEVVAGRRTQVEQSSVEAAPASPEEPKDPEQLGSAALTAREPAGGVDHIAVEPDPAITEVVAAPSNQQTAPIIEALLDHRREYIQRREPRYPARLFSAGVEGTVLVEVIVGTDGMVENITVLKSDQERFTRAVEEVVKTYQYKPGTMNGEPVRFRLVERFAFKLRK